MTDRSIIILLLAVLGFAVASAAIFGHPLSPEGCVTLPADIMNQIEGAKP